MKCGDTMMAWDYVNDVALPEAELRKDKARWAASERVRFCGASKGQSPRSTGVHGSVLFIGGSQDGRWLRIPAEQRFVKMTVGDHDEEYRSERLGAPGKTWTVYLLASLAMTAAMEKLLLGYSPNNRQSATSLNGEHAPSNERRHN